VHASFGRTKTLPWGVDGGASGSENRLEHVKADGTLSCHGRISSLNVNAGDRVRLITGGGGGWGDPALREPNLVAQDVRDGLLTSDKAKRAYSHAAIGVDT
jgi:N-methylhydantoinase B